MSKNYIRIPVQQYSLFLIFACFVTIPFLRVDLGAAHIPAPALAFMITLPFVILSWKIRYAKKLQGILLAVAALFFVLIISNVDASVVNTKNNIELAFYLFVLLTFLTFYRVSVKDVETVFNLYVLICVIFTCIGIYYRLFDFRATSFFTRVAVEGNAFKDVLGSRNVDAYILLIGFTISYNQFLNQKTLVRFAVSLFILFGIWMSLSRGAFVGAILVLLISQVIYSRTSLIKIGLFILLNSIVAFAAIYGLSSIESLEPTRDRFLFRLENWQESPRVDLALEGFRIGLNHPFNGVGLSNFQFHTTHYNEVATMTAHNGFANLFAETGILGLLLFSYLLFKPTAVLLNLNKKSENGLIKSNSRVALSICIALIYMNLFNAFYIDGAFVFWMFFGLVFIFINAAMSEIGSTGDTPPQSSSSAAG